MAKGSKLIQVFVHHCQQRGALAVRIHQFINHPVVPYAQVSNKRPVGPLVARGSTQRPFCQGISHAAHSRHHGDHVLPFLRLLQHNAGRLSERLWAAD